MNFPAPNRFISINAEKAILGTFLSYPTCYLDHTQFLSPEYFGDEQHKFLIIALKDMARGQKPSDPILVHEHLKSLKLDRKAGELPAIWELLQFNTHSPEGLGHYFDELMAYWKTRKTYDALRIGMDKLRNFDKPNAHSASEILRAALLDIENLTDDDVIRRFPDVASQTIKEYEKSISEGKTNIGLLSGFEDLDAITRGFNKQNLIVLAARPAMGKTALALQLFSNMYESDEEKKPTIFFSLEMSDREIVNRYFAFAARVPGNSISRHNFSEVEFIRILDASAKIVNQNMFICDKANINIQEIESICRKMRRKHGSMGCIVIDYIQLIKPSVKSDSREREISQISSALKQLAKELDCPVLVLAQLNRNIENRTNKKPMPSDLRESGAIEQDADLILLLHKPEPFVPSDDDPKNRELVVGKNRHGAIGDISLAFESKYPQFLSAKKDPRKEIPW